jgi:hypothetical protein
MEPIMPIAISPAEARALALEARASGAAVAFAQIRDGARQGHMTVPVDLVPFSHVSSPEVSADATAVAKILEDAGFLVDRQSMTTALVGF